MSAARIPTGDMLSTLVAAEDAEIKLTPQEVAGFAMLLLVAGNETTTNLIGNAMLALTADPAQLRIVTDDAAMIPNMIEEALRYDSPVQFLFRLTTQETQLGGQTIPAGNPIVPIYASANRDEEKFPDAARFDVTRNAQGHIAFGLGPHFCLGAPARPPRGEGRVRGAVRPHAQHRARDGAGTLRPHVPARPHEHAGDV